MANQFRLVQSIIDDAVYRADVQGQDDRHPAANRLQFFNESAQQLRTRLTNLGYEWFLRRTATAQLPIVPALTGETYAEINWPSDTQRVYGIHVLFMPGLWLPLRPISISGIRDYQFARNPWARFGIQGQ